MPREFKDFSQEVSQGTDQIIKGLDDVRSAADAADVASGKLSNTQNKGIGVADKYAKSMAGVSKELSSVLNVSKNISQGMSAVDTSARSLGSSLSGIKSGAGEATAGLSMMQDVSEEVADSLEKISGTKVKPEFDTEGAKAAKKAVEDLEDAMEDVKNVPKPDAEAWKKFQKELEQINIEKLFNSVSDGINRIQDEITKLEGAEDVLDELQRKAFLDFKVQLAGYKEFEEFIQSLPEAEQANLALVKAIDGTDEAIKELASTNELFAAKLRIAEAAAKDAAEASKTYKVEVEKSTGILAQFNNKLEEGANEAENFAGGLGVGNGAAIATGVAVFFLAQKVSDLIDEFKDAAVELSNFNVNLAALENRAQALGFAGSFDGLRNELNLTRAQSEDFFRVLEDGALSGVITVNELQQAAKQLTATFGGDQTARLEEYVNLLKEIPTLETDLAVTASLDDRAASVFALARKGEIGTVIDLQAAGLAGGAGTEPLSPADLELIDAAQKTEKTIEDVQDTLLSFFPKWGPQFAAGVDGIGKVVAGIGALVAGLGTLSVLGGSQIAAQKGTTAAVLGTGLGGGRGRMLGGGKAGSIFGRGGGRVVQRGIIKTLGPGLAKGLTRALPSLLGSGGAAASAGGAVAAAAWPVAIAAAVVAIGASLAYAGSKATDFGDELIDEGKKLQGGFAKITGAALKVQGAMMVFGPLTGLVVGATLAFDDYLDGVEAIGQGLNEQVGGIKKYSGILQGAGGALENFAQNTRKIKDNVVKGIKGFISEVPGTVREFRGVLLEEVLGSDIGKSIEDGLRGFEKAVVDGSKRLVFSEEYLKEQERLGPRIKEINARLEQVAKTSEAYDKTLKEFQRGQQQSALALQKELQATASAVESGKVAFLDFRNEVNSLQLDSLMELGGTASAFDAALKQATDGVVGRFDKVSEALVKRRKDILTNSKLNASDRRNALLDLKKAELEATQVFVEGITKIIGTLIKTPQIIKAGLEGAFAEAKFEFKVEEGIGDFGADFDTQVQSFTDELNGALDGWAKTTEKLTEAENKFNETRKKALDGIADSIGKISKGGQALIGDLDFKNQDEVREKFDKIQKEYDDTSAKIDDITEDLSPKSFTALSQQLQKSNKDLETWKKATASSKKAYDELAEELAQDPRDADLQQKVKEAKKTLEENEKLFRDAEKSQAEALQVLYDNFGKELSQGGKNSEDNVKKALKQVAEGLRKGLSDDEIIGAADDGKLALDALKLINKQETEQEKLIKGKLKTLQKEANDQSQALGVLEAFVSGETIVNKLLDERNKNFEEVRRIAGQSKKIAEGIIKQFDAVAKTEKRELEIIKSRQALASLTSSTTENLLDEQQKQNQIATKQLSAYDELVAKAQALREGFLKQAEAAQARGVDPTGFLIAAKDQEQAIVELNMKRAETVEALGKTGELVGEALDRFNESLSGRRIQQEFDLSDALAEFAKFSSDFEGTIEKSTDIAIASAKRRAREERRILEESIKAEEEALKVRATGAGSEEERNRVLNEGRRFIEAKKLTELARIETEQKQRVIDAAQREADLKTEAIEKEQNLLEEQIGFLSDIGGSFAAINNLVNQSLDYEREKLRIAEENLEIVKATTKDSKARRDAEIAVELQRIKFQKKAFGVQKDVFEKLIGAAFGEIRGEVGAARRRGSVVGLAGRDATRVVGQAGNFLKNDLANKTIEQRRNERMLRGMQDLGGEIKKGRAGAEEPLGGGPQRLKIEEQIAQYNQTTADQISKLTKAGTEKGSIYTHDITTEGLLKTIADNTSLLVKSNEEINQAELKGVTKDEFMNKFKEASEKQTSAIESEKKEVAGVAKEQVSKQEELKEALEKEAKAEITNPLAGNEMLTSDEFRRKLSGRDSEVAEEVKKNREADRENVEDVTKTTPAETEAAQRPATNQTVVPESTDQMSAKDKQREERANQEDVKGMGSTGTQEVREGSTTAATSEAAMTVNIQGQVNIALNTDMIQAEMATWVAQVISTSEVRSELDKRYLSSNV